MSDSKPVPADKPARITEQDAREIAGNVMEFNYDHKHSVDYWMREEGYYLLNKLNADREEDVDSEVQRLIHERQCLAEAIAGIAAASGDTRTDFTGPDLLQVCGDAAEGIKRLLADREQVSAVAVPDARILDLAERLVAPGPKCCALSASECHEISDFIRDIAAAPSHSQQSAEYRCHKCGAETPPPEPFKAYVKCACGTLTAATAALADDRSPSQQSSQLIDDFAMRLAEKFQFGMSGGDVFAEAKAFKLDRCPSHERDQP